jgi:hypothetical protein
VVAVEHRTLDTLRWATLEVDATGADIATLTGQIGDAVRGALATADGRPMLARLSLAGETDLHAALASDTERLAAECRGAAIEAGGDLWVEKVRIGTRPRRADLSDAMGPLRDAFAAGLSDPARVAQLLADMQALRGKVPAPAREALDVPADEAQLARLAEEAWQVAAAAIAAEEQR